VRAEDSYCALALSWRHLLRSLHLATPSSDRKRTRGPAIGRALRHDDAIWASFQDAYTPELIALGRRTVANVLCTDDRLLVTAS
jgi:hypothetical protein